MDMRVVTTSSRQGFEDYGYRWLEGRKNWPKAEFIYYTEGFGVDCDSKECADIPEFAEWKAKHRRYVPPTWQFDVVRYAHKVFAAYDALRDYDGIGVWLDADCVTYKKLPKDLIERQLGDAYFAHYGRTGMYTETGLWIVNCAHSQHKPFFDFWRNVYLTERYKQLPHWTDCLTLDATIRAFSKLCTFHNLSGEHHKAMHPQALSELGKYIDHCKGPRKVAGKSPENKRR